MDATTDRFAGFSDVIGSFDEVMEILGEPIPSVITKETDRLDDICRTLIAKSPFCIIASSNPEGFIDVSPRVTQLVSCVSWMTNT